MELWPLEENKYKMQRHAVNGYKNFVPNKKDT